MIKGLNGKKTAGQRDPKDRVNEFYIVFLDSALVHYYILPLCIFYVLCKINDRISVGNNGPKVT